MAGLFGNKMNNGMGGNYVDPNSPQFLRRKYESQYNSSRYNLLLVAVLTAINIITITLQTGSYFPFSAYVPTAFLDLALYLCGKYPAEAYEGAEPFEFFSSSLLTIAIIVSVIIALSYLLCFLLAGKKRVGLLITGLCFICIDTLLMFLLGGIAADSLLDIAFHAWVIISLSMGISAHSKLKKLPEDIPVTFEDVSNAAQSGTFAGNVESQIPNGEAVSEKANDSDSETF